MAVTYVYPTTQEMRLIEADLLPQLEDGRIGLDLFPVVNDDVWEIIWEQEDNYVGLQQVRGLDGQPARVQRVGAKGYKAEPGVYGEFTEIKESELTRRRQLGSVNQPISIDDFVRKADEYLLVRELDRIELLVWTLMTTGTYAVSNENGVLHADTFPILTSTPAVPWSTVATATPVADLRALRLNQYGHSVNFGRAAKLYVNTKKVNQLLSNSNAADLGGYTKNADRLITLEDYNRILIAQDLPEIVEYHRGYLNDSGTFVPFIPDNKGVLVGPRTNGEAIGEYRKTRNANNLDLGPGSYSRVIDRGEDQIPRKIEVHRGHNGGPAIFYPGSIIALTI